uniref:CUB domain-containing protein n=1 Tax=Ciona intestinalis TaxID=7719 RepID=F6S1M9_CIOIN
MKATSAMRVVWFFTTLLVLFSLHGASVTATQTCGGQITGTGSGRVMSPYHPQKYPKNASCVWTIVVDVGSGLRLEVEHLNNKELSNSGSTGQCYDTLDIYQVIPAGTERRITPSLCASSVAELTTNVFEVPAIGGSTVIRIRFKSDYAIQLSGFSISYKAMCNVTVQNSTGVLTSPGYPSLYPENIVCMTRIITPQDTTVHFSFEQFILEDSADCTSDSLTINTNQGSGIRSVGKKYCGNKNPGQIVATSNDVTITFISDGSFPKLGFIAKWSTGASDTPVTTEATTMDVSTTTDALGALLPVTINAGEVQPKTNNGTQDKSFNRKDELNNNQWFIYVVVVFLLFATTL